MPGFVRRMSVLFVLLGLCLAPAFGATIDALDIAKIRSAGSSAISPDGTQVAYLLSVPRELWEEDSGRSWNELHVVGADGTDRTFISGHQNVSSIRWAPDGSGIFFLAKRGDDKFTSLYRISMMGGEAVQVLKHEAAIGSYDIHADGKTVAFTAKPKEDKKEKKLKKKGFNAEVFEENLHNVGVWIAELSGEARRLDLKGSASSIVWSPVDDRLLLMLAPTPLIDDSYMRKRIHIVDSKSGDVLQSFKTEGKLGALHWSTDGKSIGMIAAADLNDPSAGRLWVGDAATGKISDRLPNLMGHVQSFVWKDADTIVYVADIGVWTRIAEVGSKGKPKTLVKTGSTILSSISISKNGSAMAMQGQSPSHPSEVFLLDAGSAGAKRLTDSNPWLADRELGPQEVVKFKARDGLALEGILVRPLHEEKGQRYPLVLTVHGGPESHHRNGWMTGYSGPAQMLSAAGFAVFYTNYRASTGYGVEFSKMDHKDMAGGEFDDLVDAVDHLIGTGLVDKDRVGVTGGSYGGYATGWLSTFYSERFAAGVMFVGISDLISKVGTSDIRNELYEVHARVRPWEDWQLFLERSPIYHVQKAKTPLLIMGGKDDTRVYPGQSLALYTYLKMAGDTPVRLVRYPGEGHGNRKSAARFDYTLRMMRWMKHYLQDGGTDLPPAELEYPFGGDDDEDSEEE